MFRDQTVHAWWIANLIIVTFVYACAQSGEGAAVSASATPDEEEDAASPTDENDDGEAKDGGRKAPDEEDAAAPSCPAPIPAGELQDRASGASVFGRVVESTPGWYDTSAVDVCGVGGVRICLFDTETCTESNEAGQFILEDLPSDSDVEISFEKSGYRSVLRLAHLQGAPVNLAATRLLGTSDLLAVFEGLELEPDHGTLVAIPLEPGEAIGTVTFPEGVVITLVPGSNEPYYSRGMLEPDGLSSDELDPELEATRPGGWAMFPSLEAGDYSVRFERDGIACSFALPGFGFGADEEGNIRVRVRAGFTTSAIAALCQ